MGVELTLRPLLEVILRPEHTHLHAHTCTTLPHRQRLALIRPVIPAKRLPGLDFASIGRDIDAQGAEPLRGAVHVDEVGPGRADVAEDEGVDGGDGRGVVLVQGAERRVRGGREAEGVGLGGEVQGEVDGEGGAEEPEEGGV